MCTANQIIAEYGTDADQLSAECESRAAQEYEDGGLARYVFEDGSALVVGEAGYYLGLATCFCELATGHWTTCLADRLEDALDPKEVKGVIPSVGIRECASCGSSCYVSDGPSGEIEIKGGLYSTGCSDYLLRGSHVCYRCAEEINGE